MKGIVPSALDTMNTIQWPKLAKDVANIDWPKVVKDAGHNSLGLAKQQNMQKDKEIKALQIQIRTLQTDLAKMAAKDAEIMELRTQFAMELAIRPTGDDAVRIKKLFGGNASDILNSMSKEARDKRMPAYLAWRRDKKPLPPDGGNNATSRKGGRRSSRRLSRRSISKKHRSRRNRY